MKTNNKKVEDNFYGKRVVKEIFVKAKFSHLSTMLDMLDYQSANDQEDLARKNIKGLAQSIGKLNPTKDEWSRYVKIAKSLGFSESQISGFARTGYKAKFAVVGSKGNKTAIVIRNGPDADASWIAYVVQDYKTSNEDVIGNMRHYSTEARAKAAALRGLETSGLRASRQGSKAKFANGVYGNEEIARGLSKVLKANGFNAMASEVLSGSTDSETLRKYIRALKSKMSPMSGNDRGMVLLQTLEKQLASRTGSKAKFATVKSQGHTFRIDHFDGDEYKLYMLLDGEFKFIKKTEQPQRWIEANVRSGDPSKWLPSAYSRTGAKVFK